METCASCGGEVPPSGFKVLTRLCLECAEEQAHRLALATFFVEQSRAGVPHQAHSVVWEFKYAHRSLRELSSSGGDEDWIALVFVELNWAPPWIMALGVCDVEEVRLLNGWTVFIGSHS